MPKPDDLSGGCVGLARQEVWVGMDDWWPDLASSQSVDAASCSSSTSIRVGQGVVWEYGTGYHVSRTQRLDPSETGAALSVSGNLEWSIA
eukprot:153959-Rhodomonas_salina.1